MQITVHNDKIALGAAAAAEGARAIGEALAARGAATVVVATGASQFEMLDALVQQPIDWSRVTAFHLDEYVGLGITHKASFRRYLEERFLSRLPQRPAFVGVDGDAPDLAAELQRLGGLIGGRSVDVCFAGIGENGHLAFNDPPADFETEDAYLVVDLDEACRRQQLGEGWFPDLAAVPAQAISMSIRQILRADHIVLSVPDERKAVAVKGTVEGPVSPLCPASILQQHPRVSLHLDQQSASLLTR